MYKAPVVLRVRNAGYFESQEREHDMRLSIS